MKFRSEKLLIVFVLVIQLFVFWYFGSLKSGMHFDECFSYFNTNNSVGRQCYDRTFVSSEDIMKDFYVLEGEQFNYSYVVKLQSYDVHPPVFYLFLHTLCSFMPGVFSMWQGLALNLFYSLCASYFLYLIFKEFVKKEYTACLLTLLVAINPGVICNFLYIRMYCLMALWIVMAVYLHIRISKEDINKLKPVYYIFTFILTYLGFLTHYFYLVFLFFIEAAFVLPKLFTFRKNIKGVLKYCITLLSAGILGVITYPSCLGHVNSGYRGQEVKGYLFDLSDIFSRIKFFGGLINRFVFQNFGVFFVLVIVMLLLYMYFVTRKGRVYVEGFDKAVQFIIIPALGYFLVSAKASLVGDETMMRYQLPIYPLIIMGTVLILYMLITTLLNTKLTKLAGFALIGVFLVLNVCGILKQNVFYLYKEQATMERIADKYKEETCIYIYNNEDNKYLLWNDAMQLAKYKDVYFIFAENTDAIEDVKINSSKEAVVYISSLGEHENFNDYSEMIYANTDGINSYEKLYDAMYATAYRFYRTNE